MSKVFAKLFGILFNPPKSIRMILLGKPLFPALISFSGFLISIFISQLLHIFSSGPPDSQALLFLFGFEIIGILFLIFLFSALFHLTADILGGGGRGINLFYFSLISLLPLWFRAVSTYLFEIVLSSPKADFWITIFLAAWSLIIFILCIGELYRFSFVKALVTFIIPVILTGCIVALFFTTGSDRIAGIVKTAADIF